MEPQRINVKYFVKNPSAVNLPDFIPVFHRWIQDHSVEGLPIDVADYRHVHEGPGILLIGHEGDYAMDMRGGRPGLLYERKRETNGASAAGPATSAEPALRSRLRSVFRQALLACQLLEAEPSLEGQITFRTDEAQLSFVDRLRTPNKPETFEALREDILAVLRELYAENDIHLKPIHEDPRQCFAVHIHVPGAADLATLIGRLEAGGIR